MKMPYPIKAEKDQKKSRIQFGKNKMDRIFTARSVEKYSAIAQW